MTSEGTMGIYFNTWIAINPFRIQIIGMCITYLVILIQFNGNRPVNPSQL